jgi:hypothetical protein
MLLDKKKKRKGGSEYKEPTLKDYQRLPIFNIF